MKKFAQWRIDQSNVSGERGSPQATFQKTFLDKEINIFKSKHFEKQLRGVHDSWLPVFQTVFFKIVKMFKKVGIYLY